MSRKNNVVDFSALEEETTEGEQVAQAENSSAQNLTSGQENTGELDYDPYYAEADRKLNEAGAASEQEEAAQQAQAGAEAGALPDAGTAQQEEMSVGYAEIDRSPQDDAAEEAPEGESGEGGESAGESGAESADGGRRNGRRPDSFHSGSFRSGSGWTGSGSGGGRGRRGEQPALF